MSRTILITGATDGLGRALAERAAAEGWDVLAHGRSDEKLAALLPRPEAFLSRPEASPPADASPLRSGVRTFRADLASLDEVAGLAAAVEAATDRLDVLVSNAGIGGSGPRDVSADGHELRFAVNYLAGYALIRRLLPLLRRSTPARIVQVASAGQAPIDFRDVMLERGYDGTRAYCQSKLAQIMLTLDLADELDPAEVTATALHPATYMPTKMVTDAGINPLSPLEHGVDATWRLIADPAVEGVSGVYFDGTRAARPDGQALDPDDRARLRELSQTLTGV